jgi:hypothetical protein
MKGELKLCPFCGSRTAPELADSNDLEQLEGDDTLPNPYFAVVCDVHAGGCGATGGYGATAKRAVSKWNKRREGDNDD